MRAFILVLFIMAMLFMVFNYIANSDLNATTETQAMFDVVTSLLTPVVYVFIGIFMLWLIAKALTWIFGKARP